MSYDATLDEMTAIFLAADPITHQADFQKPVHKLGTPVGKNRNPPEYPTYSWTIILHTSALFGKISACFSHHPMYTSNHRFCTYLKTALYVVSRTRTSERMVSMQREMWCLRNRSQSCLVSASRSSHGGSTRLSAPYLSLR